jgi:very-short-patch-repair endonuclease
VRAAVLGGAAGLLTRLRGRGTTRSVVEGEPHAPMRAPDFIRDRARELRRGMTQPERDLWAMLRRGATGMRFRRQHPLGAFILDFYCPAAKLAVEVDGLGHEGAGDEKRSAWLAGEGVRVLRFTAAEIAQRPAWVLATIAQAAPPSTA